MKASGILLLCSALALPQLAMADLSGTDPRGLGVVYAVLKYCTEVDPRDAASFYSEWTSVVGRAPGQQLDRLEGSSAYKQESDTVTSALSAMPKQDVAKACAAGAAQWNGGERSGEREPHRPTGRLVKVHPHGDASPSNVNAQPKGAESSGNASVQVGSTKDTADPPSRLDRDEHVPGTKTRY